MRENKSLRSVVAWTFRITIPLFVYLAYGGFLLDGIDLTSSFELIILAAAILAVLLFIGAFTRKDTLTKLSAVLLMIVSVIAVLKGFDLVIWFYPFFVSFYFLIYGNSY